MNGERARAALRAALLAWLLIAIVLLAVMLLRPETQGGERAGLSALVPLYFMSFPLGHVGVDALSWLKVQLYTGNGYALDIRSEGMLLWAALTALGLLQWFVLLPWAARQCRRATQFLSRRFLAR